MFIYESIFKDKQNVLFVMAHPDDSIAFYGALINKLAKDKKNIYVVCVTNGARGSRENKISEEDLAKNRIAEEICALETLGVPKENYTCLNYKDGEVESTYKLIGEISKYIRKHKADIVCTHEPTAIYSETYKKDGFFIQHRDHRKIAEAVVDSAYPFSRDLSFFPEHAIEGIEPHEVYDILLTDEVKSNFELDYSLEVETKKAAMRCYKSQWDEETINEIIGFTKDNNKYLEKYFYLKLLW